MPISSVFQVVSSNPQQVQSLVTTLNGYVTTTAASQTAAATSETNAAASETNASGHATTALGHANTASGHSTTASGHATAALGHANTASGHATTASGHSTTASGHATTASGHSTDASNSKDDASKLAITAEDSQYTLSDGVTQGYSALHYAAKADASKVLAVNAQTAAENALDDFTDQYLGSKNTSGGEPTTDNDGNTLVSGTLFWDDTNGIMKVYNGSAWVAAYASSGGSLTAVNNLSDLSDAGVSRTNLGLGTAAVLDTGTSANNAVQLDGSARLPAVDGSQLTGLPAGYTGWTVSDGTNSENIASTDTVAFAGSGATTVAYDTSTNTLTVSSTDNDTTYTTATTSAEGLLSATDKTKLDGIEASADVTDATNVTAAGAAMLTGATFTGAVTATSFTGDGANLTNLPVSTPTLSSLGIANHDQLSVDASGNVSFGDNDKAIFGAGSDLQIYHDGGSSWVSDVGVGNLKLSSDGAGVFLQKGTTEFMGEFLTDGAVRLYYDNAAKFETTATGVTVTGTAVATTSTASITGNTTLDFAANQNFVLTLTSDITLVNPTTEQLGQSGFFVFVQDATGNRLVSLDTNYKTAGGSGLLLSAGANAVDIVPYVVQATDSILLGTPQLAFA
jgi:hypothetical protein